MHEFSICQNLVDAAVAEARQAGGESARVKTVRAVIGSMRQIIPDHMQFAFETLTRETSASGAELVIIPEVAIGTCGSCGWKGEVEKLFICAKCEEPLTDVEGGMELALDSIAIDVED